MKYLVYLLVLFFPMQLLADGSSIDKIYAPYVQPLEKEIEYRLIAMDQDNDLDQNLYAHKLGFGRAVDDRLFIEAYIIGEKEENGNLKTEAWELEARYQLTEQGEYSIDWGSLFELEKSNHGDSWEAKAGLLASKDIDKMSLTGNLFLIYEWGQDTEIEHESALGLQARYRWRSWLEPGVEFYSSEGTRGIGPVIQGVIKLENMKSLYWHLGLITGLVDETPDTTIKFQLEYEFL